MNIKLFPPYVFSPLKFLTVLELYNDSIESIHEFTFHGLNSLFKLDLSKNLLHNTGNAFTMLLNLTHLNLSNNYLKYISGHAFVNNSKLISIDLGFNFLTLITSGGNNKTPCQQFKRTGQRAKRDEY